MTFTIRRSRAEDAQAVIAIWRAAVDATHHFLAAEDRDAIDEEVSEFLPRVPLWIAADSADLPIAFMLLLEGHMEALFVHPAYSGVGVGSALVRHGLTLHPNLTTDVNEPTPSG